MATQRIGNNRITDGEVTGPKLGVNSIGANNFSSAANTYISNAAAASPSITAAFNTANAAFTAANNSLSTDVTQNNSVASAFVHANAAFLASNTATLLNDGVNLTQNNSIGAVFLQSNNNVGVDLTQNNSITVALNTANAAFANANSYITYNEGVNIFQNADTLYANIQSVTETSNIYTTAIGGNTPLYLANNSAYYFSANPTANVTFNLRANSQDGGTLDNYMTTGQMISVGIMLSQGATAYRANLHIDGVLQTANTRWSGNVNPAGGGTINGIDVYSFSVLKTGANSYIILASNTAFANGATSVY